MKIAKIILLFLALLLTNCSGELEQEYGLMPPAPSQVTFLLGLQEDDTSAIQTRNGEPEQIARMWYAIANDRGEMLKPLYQKLEADFSKLTIEGLGYGDYTSIVDDVVRRKKTGLEGQMSLFDFVGEEFEKGLRSPLSECGGVPKRRILLALKKKCLGFI